MAYYLKFPADTGGTNSYLVQISGVSGSAVISYKLAEDQPLFDNRAIYLFDIRRSLNSTSSSGGTGFILRTDTGSINTSGTTNHKINGSSVSGSDLFTSNPLEDDVCQFETSSSVTSGVFSFGARFNEVEGFSDLAVKNIIVTDNNGTHTIDMSDSGGTLSTFDSTDGTITLKLFNFPGDNSQWVFYNSGDGKTAAGAVVLPSLVVAGTATDTTSVVTAAGAVVLPSLVVAGTATDTDPPGLATAAGAVVLPSLVVAGTATDTTSVVTAAGAVVLPSLVVAASAVSGRAESDFTIEIDNRAKMIQTTLNNFTIRI